MSELDGIGRELVTSTGVKLAPSKADKVRRELERALDRAAPSAVRVLEEIANDRDAPASARVSAARELLDRKLGKAAVAYEVKQVADPSMMHLEALRAMSAPDRGTHPTVIDGQAFELP
jgi:sugar-specific transcriptional regulator TrmB